MSTDTVVRFELIVELWSALRHGTHEKVERLTSIHSFHGMERIPIVTLKDN